MHMNTSNHKNIDLEDYEEIFKGKIIFILEKISRFFKEDTAKDTSSKEKMLNLYDPFVQKRINEIKDTTESIAEYLKIDHILYDEYYDFREIQQLMNLSLDYGSIEELEIILKILNEFKRVNEFKFDLLNINSPSKDMNFLKIDEKSKKIFEKRYKEFSKFFFKCQMEYYAIFEGECEEDVTEFFELMNDPILK